MPILRVAAAFLILALVPAAILAIILAFRDDSVEGVTFDAVPFIVEATARVETGSEPVEVRLTWDAGEELLSPPWSGTVTRIYAQPGQTLTTGSGIAAINGVGVIAAHSPDPFHRPIARNATGPDVAALNDILVQLGLLTADPPPAETATLATVTAIRALESILGVENPTGVFLPAYFVWLPNPTFELLELHLTRGTAAPSPGSTLAISAASLTNAAVSPIQAGGIPGQGGGRLELHPEVEWVLDFSGQEFPVDPLTSAIAPEALATLAELFPDQRTDFRATVRRAEPLDTAAIPSSAVMSNSAGRLCVWVPAGQEFTAVPVEVVGSRLGVTTLASGVAAGEPVLANPSQVLESPACP